MTDVHETTQQTRGVENYESKLVDITDCLNNLLNESVDDDSVAKEKIWGALDDGFVQWIKDNPEKAQNLKLLVERFVEEINKSGSALKREDFSNLLDFAKNVLWVEVDMSVSPDIVPSNLPELSLNWTLENLENDWNNLYLYWLVREKPTIHGESQDTTPEEKRFYEVVDRVNFQLKNVSELLSNTLLSNNANLKFLNNLLGKIQVVLGNTSKNNVKLLQKYIYDNLEGDEKSVFGSKNHQETGFDGKFGVSTLKWLNLILDKIWNHIEELKKWVENQWVQVSQDWTWEWNWSQMLQGGGSEWDWSQVLQEWDWQWSSPVEWSGWESSETVAYPTDTTPLTIWDSSYWVMNVGTTCDGATFYSTQCLWWGQSVDSEGTFVDAPTGIEFECYMRLNDKPGNLYKVKIDSSWYLCPIASEIDTTTIWKNGDYITNNILFKNNDSCIKYLENKLPSGLNCKIYWDPESEDYRIESYWGKSLTIEPMTVWWCWVSQDLTECLALLNFTNYLRSWTNENYGGKEPDLKLKKDSLFVELKGGGWWEISQDFLASLWLWNISKDVWKRFIDYNNSEGWKKGSDGLKNNQYKKIDFPSVMLVWDWNRMSEQSQFQEQQQWQVDGQESYDGFHEEAQSQLGQVENNWLEEQVQQQEQADAQNTGIDVQSEQQNQSEQFDQNSDVVETNNIVDISALWDVDPSEYDAMQSFLWSDKQFVIKSDNGVSCDLYKVKAFLEEISNKDWNYFKSLKWGEYTAWIIAVQLLLNEWRKKNIWEKAWIRITWLLHDGPYKNDKFAYSTRWNLTMFQSKVWIQPMDWLPWKDTISKLLELVKIIGVQPVWWNSDLSESWDWEDIGEWWVKQPLVWWDNEKHDWWNGWSDVVDDNWNGLITDGIDNLDVNQPVS